MIQEAIELNFQIKNFEYFIKSKKFSVNEKEPVYEFKFKRKF